MSRPSIFDRCCENGYFGDGHLCRKQPGDGTRIDERAPDRAAPLRTTVDELHVMNGHLADIVMLLKLITERAKLTPPDKTM